MADTHAGVDRTEAPGKGWRTFAGTMILVAAAQILAAFLISSCWSSTA